MTYAPRNRVWSAEALTEACVSHHEVMDHLRLTGSEEAGVIDSLTRAAQGVAERRIQRLLTRRAVTLRMPGLPTGVCPVELPGGEVGTVTSVTADGSAIAGAVAVGDSPALLLPATDWPVVTGTGYPVVIVYQAGFAVVPDEIRVAIKMLAAEMFERRSHGDVGAVVEVPVSAQFLLDPWRIRPI